MDSAIQGFFSAQFFFISLAIAALTYVARLGIEHVLDKPEVPVSSSSKFWKRVFLPSLPILLGSLILFIPSIPCPEPYDTEGGRMIFGLVAGLFSGYAYRIVKAVVFKEEDKQEDKE